jgi:proteasome lid subunit RPN8/RPN11
MSTPPQTTGPDVSQLKDKTLPEAPFPGGRTQSFRVYLAPEVHAGIWQHAVENGAVEICGVVVGRWAHDASGPHAQGTAYIRGEAASSKFAEVTFTHETWARINQQMDTKYADQSVIGWYHSHPDFGIFLSDRDRFIQEHFFAGPGQFAYVVDPVRKTEGVFVWNKGKATLAPYHWVGDRIQVSTPAAEAPAHGEREGGNKQSSEPGAAGPATSSAAAWIDAVMRPAGYICVFLMGLVFAGFVTRGLNESERVQFEQIGGIKALVLSNFRLGLGEELEEVGKDLQGVKSGLEALIKQQPELVNKSDETKEKWGDVEKKLARARVRVDFSRETFAPTKEESALLRRLLNGIKSGDSKPGDGKTGDGKTEKTTSPNAAAAGSELDRKAGAAKGP